MQGIRNRHLLMHASSTFSSGSHLAWRVPWCPVCSTTYVLVVHQAQHCKMVCTLEHHDLILEFALLQSAFRPQYWRTHT